MVSLVLSLLPLSFAPGLAHDGCNYTVTATTGALLKAAHHVATALGSAAEAVDYTVCLEAGDHVLHGSALRLNSSHNHPRGARVVWRGIGRPVGGPQQTDAPATGKPRIRGGVQLTKWLRCVDGTHCNWPDWNDVWVHFVKDIPFVTTSDVPFRQLWVGGQRASRVVIDGDTLGLKTTATGYSSAAPVGGAWVADKVELRWPSQIKNWIEPRCIVTDVNGTEITVAPECWVSLTARNGGHLAPPPVLIDNVGRPPGPGEFYATPTYVFYRPFSSDPYEAPNDVSVAISNREGRIA